MSRREIEWDTVLYNLDYIGGDLELEEDGYLFRGPVKRKLYSDRGRLVEFHLSWFARYDLRSKEWRYWSSGNLVSVSTEFAKPYRISEGRVRFHIPHIGICTLHRNWGRRLKPEDVVDLPKNSERLLALFPDLAFDRDVVMEALKMIGWSAKIEDLKKLPDDIGVADFLTAFREDRYAEEFLCRYIEIKTGERNVHDKIY